MANITVASDIDDFLKGGADPVTIKKGAIIKASRIN